MNEGGTPITSIGGQGAGGGASYQAIYNHETTSPQSYSTHEPSFATVPHEKVVGVKTERNAKIIQFPRTEKHDEAIQHEIHELRLASSHTGDTEYEHIRGLQQSLREEGLVSDEHGLIQPLASTQEDKGEKNENVEGDKTDKEKKAIEKDKTKDQEEPIDMMRRKIEKKIAKGQEVEGKKEKKLERDAAADVQRLILGQIAIEKAYKEKGLITSTGELIAPEGRLTRMIKRLFSNDTASPSYVTGADIARHLPHITYNASNEAGEHQVKDPYQGFFDDVRNSRDSDPYAIIYKAIQKNPVMHFVEEEDENQEAGCDEGNDNTKNENKEVGSEETDYMLQAA